MSVDSDLRKHPRKRVLKDGQLISDDMQSLVNVRIRDLSENGARAETTGYIQLPEVFKLLIVSEKAIYPCRARWRRGMQIGIEFTGPPAPLGLRKVINSYSRVGIAPFNPLASPAHLHGR